MNLCAFAPVFIAETYFFIYYLLPNTVVKKKYLLFLIGFLLTYIMGIVINYFTAERFLAITQFFPNTFQHRIEMSNYNTRWGMIIATLGLGIKLTKGWYLQQKENLEILKRKARTEMQSEKARIHPELLLRSLDTIYNDIQSSYNKAPMLILNLSEVLSYSLYENENDMVLLKDELLQLQHLITLEQEKKAAINIEMQIKGNIDKYIAPMVLVKTMEQIISHLYKAKIFSCLLQLQLVMVDDTLLSNFTLLGETENILQDIPWPLFITNTQSRLSSYYSATDFNVELKQHENKIIFSIKLKLSKHFHETSSQLNTVGTANDNL